MAWELLISLRCYRVPCTGSFGVGGSVSLAAGSTLANADAIFVGNGGSFLVTSPATFDLAGVGGYGATVTLRDIPAFSPFAPVSAFVAAGNGTTVTLRSLSVALQNATFLNFFGEVDLLGPGFDLTPGIMTGTATTIHAASRRLRLPSPRAPPSRCRQAMKRMNCRQMANSRRAKGTKSRRPRMRPPVCPNHGRWACWALALRLLARRARRTSKG